jgi:hypothetical protein
LYINDDDDDDDDDMLALGLGWLKDSYMYYIEGLKVVRNYIRVGIFSWFSTKL